jgi:hypothetical protein
MVSFNKIVSLLCTREFQMLAWSSQGSLKMYLFPMSFPITCRLFKKESLAPLQTLLYSDARLVKGGLFQNMFTPCAFPVIVSYKKVVSLLSTHDFS